MKYQFDVVNGAEGRAHHVDYRVEAGQGVMSTASRVIALRPDLLLNISAVRPGIEAKFKFEIGKAPVQFGFVVSGSNRCTYYDGALKNQTHLLKQGCNGIYYFPETSGALESDHDSGVFVVSILTTPLFLDSYFKDDKRKLSCAFKKIMAEQKEQFYWRGAENPAKMSLLLQIIQNKYSDGVQKMFLESRVLELLAWQLNECLGADPDENRNKQSLRTKDVERIQAAKELLVKDFENPPSVAMLAKLVGINEKKLKIGFKQVFGRPVFEYFREYRLERARELLVSGDVTVSEAAYQIGYQSLSHFSRAFRERYGLNPKDYGRVRGGF
ncbi:transcriptional regulator, AraC family [Solidesulfovibrio fructosivorans JJ]]|uniref:Transcriptional regulator, AraC family n=1 Tax=Solidesulfovibrio fructosivorans JJ] TaxID=596151 RepID=E1JTG4_SOLFR|nr:AraC family transcriptional regulator [Solidesulfovibrio fructosivorans]EFL52424.1 transcriptional regulator, AraC family [Solidesulfovibrio fructosivorans JJ]]